MAGVAGVPGGGKLRGKGDGERWPQRVTETLGRRTAPGEVHLPPYLPDDPVIREDWAQYLDTVRYTDWEVGRIVDRLKEASELERTVLFFITDHYKDPPYVLIRMDRLTHDNFRALFETIWREKANRTQISAYHPR